MTSNVINFRQARKAQARAKKEQQAAENRARFGRPKAERERAEKLIGIERAKLDGAHIDVDGDADTEPGTRS